VPLFFAPSAPTTQVVLSWRARVATSRAAMAWTGRKAIELYIALNIMIWMHTGRKQCRSEFWLWYLDLRSHCDFIYCYVYSAVFAQKTNSPAFAKFICVMFANVFLEAVKSVRATFINSKILIKLNFFSGQHICRIIMRPRHTIFLKFMTRHLVPHLFSLFFIASLLHVTRVVALG